MGRLMVYNFKVNLQPSGYFDNNLMVQEKIKVKEIQNVGEYSSFQSKKDLQNYLDLILKEFDIKWELESVNTTINYQPLNVDLNSNIEKIYTGSLTSISFTLLVYYEKIKFRKARTLAHKIQEKFDIINAVNKKMLPTSKIVVESDFHLT